jgi:ankyrin repeat protein
MRRRSRFSVLPSTFLFKFGSALASRARSPNIEANLNTNEERRTQKCERYAFTRFALLLITATVSLSATDGAPPLVAAVKRGDYQAVRSLLRDRAQINIPEADGTTALHWAVQADDGELIALLIKAGANVGAANRYGIRPLTLAATNGSASAISALLSAGADPKTTTGGGEPVVMTAARTGRPDAIKALVSRGADVNVREPWFGETALMWAAGANHAAAVRTLVELGADVDARSTIVDAPILEFPRSGGPNSPFPRGGWTALMFAAREGAVDAARTLADLRANLNLVAPPQTDVPLKPEEVRAAVAKGIGTTALVFAIINTHYDLAAMLLEKGADPNVVDVAGMGALYAVVDMNSLQWVQGRPAPILTDRLDGADLVRIILDKGGNPNARLTRAPLKRHHDAGSTMNFGAGATPLMRAARTNDVAVMKLLLDGGANPFLTLGDYTNALHIAAGQGFGGLRGEGIRIVIPTEAGALEAVTLLLNRGMDVDAFNSAGNTALHAAVGRGEGVVRLLASRGATLTLKNKAGFTPLDIAQGAGGRGGRGGVVREGTAKLLRELIEQQQPASPPVLTDGVLLD